MTAATAEVLGTDVLFPTYLSRKYDGIRFAVRNAVAVSKSNKPLPNQWLQALVSSRPEFEGMDGEVVVGPPTAKDVWNASNSFCMSRAKTPEDMGGRAVQLFVFDVVVEEWPHEVRQRHLNKQVKKLPAQARKLVTVVEQVLCTAPSEVQALEEQWVAVEGYEGVMGRAPDGLYKFGRSTLSQNWLWKWKRFYDAEAIVLSVKQGQHNTNEAKVNELGKTKRSSAKAGKVAKETVGGFEVKAINGPDKNTVFSCGTGELTAAECAALWAVRETLPGKVLTYKAGAATVAGGMPRYPQARRFKDPVEL